jgi:diguanylate cyclase (GGDEF)-like protein
MPTNKFSKRTFSRQIFLQYFVSAVVPVLVLSYFTYTSVSELLNKNANRQIYSESRSIGLTLFDRLLNIEGNLLFSSRYINKKEELEKYRWLNKMFHSIYTIDKGIVDEVIFGIDAFDVVLSEKQKKHLGSNGLLIVNKENEQFQPIMLLSINNDPERYIVGNINGDYLWAISLNGTDVFCIVINEKKLAFCSDGKSEIKETYFDKSGKIINLKDKTKSGPYDITINQQDYVSNVWDLFLKPQFGVESFLILYFVRKNEVFLDYSFYKSVFPQTIFITFLLVYLLSSVQMRRSLVPLEKLTHGVKKIIDGNYGAKVEINSDNEFQSLATTFNDMSTQINNQFIKINALSKIDRLILSATDTDYIVEVILRYMPSIVSGDHYSLLVFNDENSHVGMLHYFKDSTNKYIEKTNLVLEKHDFYELNNADDIIRKSENDNNAYFHIAKSQGSKYFLAYPVHDKERLLAVIIIGLKAEPTKVSNFYEDLKEISDRAAVALSNSQWEQKLFHQAHYDALTELPNRYLFNDRLEQAIERANRNNLAVAVLFIDLDRFKIVNDSLGHVVGDHLLTEVSKVLLKCVRNYDSVARFGGDEFTIIISDVSPDQVNYKAEQLSERIIEMMSESILIDEREFFISPSIGISIYPRDANNINDLLKNADTAMYGAKKISLGNYQFYQRKQNQDAITNLELERDLRQAAEKDQFELYFQPKINLKDLKVYDVEALIRWNHPDKGYIPPDDFISLAEETGLITSIGYWVMNTACSINRLWQDQGINLKIAINVSADQFRQIGFYEKMIAIINETNANPVNLELEITESITIENFAKTISLLNKFKANGLGICIDDFGTGFSSMTYLQRIPINKLKIDKSFIDSINTDEDSHSITRAIIALAHSLGHKVVAEGVETKLQYESLVQMECDEIQGYYFSPPLPEPELIEYIKQFNSKSNG